MHKQPVTQRGVHNDVASASSEDGQGRPSPRLGKQHPQLSVVFPTKAKYFLSREAAMDMQGAASIYIYIILSHFLFFQFIVLSSSFLALVS